MPPPGAHTAARTAPRRTDRRTQVRPSPDQPDRPPIRLFEPSPRRRRRPRGLARPELWAGGVLVVGSLLAVVVGDAAVAQGQIHLTQTQQAIAGATATEKTAQVAVAGMASPPVVVRTAERLGLVAPTSIVDLPAVPLNVPLPAPDTNAGSSSSSAP
jgi:hypothetical protein